ncbi:MAG: hypothetical protein H6557_22980 [Lewinellaceae bacterium]|nr:hypothetical protein [Phaeodactylibacter sp.]MCB9039491.1 hypothetical protein [Lewinellaceae bacterium]
MNLKKRKTGELFRAEIKRLKREQFMLIESDKRFGFDWSKEKDFDVYQINLVKGEEVLGLISLEEISKELRIFIRLIEVSKENQGADKEYDNVAGCLISYACMIAFERDYEGFVSLIPKTELIGHYKDNYGFTEAGTHMYLEGKKAEVLIEKYLKNG